MTAKEKAEHITGKYVLNVELKSKQDAKKCALLAVDELIADNDANEIVVHGKLNKSYWQEVKQEIEKL